MAIGTDPDRYQGITSLTVHYLGLDHVVVELHESLTAPFGGLELQLDLPSDCQGPVAWWMDELGRVAVRVKVGEG